MSDIPTEEQLAEWERLAPMADAARERHEALIDAVRRLRAENERLTERFANQMDAATELIAERDALAAEVERLTGEADGQVQLINRQGQLLTDAINAARGEPDELTLWSHHDVAEWVTKLREERDQAAAVITRVRETVESSDLFAGDAPFNALAWQLRADLRALLDSPSTEEQTNG